MSSQSGRTKRSEKGLLTPDNCVVAIIDLQPQMLFGVAILTAKRSSTTTWRSPKPPKVFDVPVVLTTVETKSFSGNMWPQIQAIFPNQTPIERYLHELLGRQELRRRHREDRPEKDRAVRTMD